MNRVAFLSSLVVLFVLASVIMVVQADSLPTFAIRVWRRGDGECEILSKGRVQHNRLLSDAQPTFIRRTAQSVVEGEAREDRGVIFHIEALSMELAEKELAFVRCSDIIEPNAPEVKVADEVFVLIDSGDPSNRIDVVLMGDGYTQDERQLFLDDMNRLVTEMWEGPTFRSFRELMNVWAVFRASAESGIGTGGRPRDTAFELYRDGTELRGIYCDDPNSARQACTATGDDACDFPSIIGNDPYYGGLGGEFTIATASHTTGTMVLRHEFGHNFGDVGEEYDGGSVYSGANFDSSLTNIQWYHWLTEPATTVVAEDAMIRVQDYAWYLLKNGNYTINFEVDGDYHSWAMRISVSGCETEGSFIVSLDGEELPWNTSGLLDRSFYEYSGPTLAAGKHTLVFAEGFPAVEDLDRQLCSVTLHEFSEDYHFDQTYIGAYPNWRQGMRFAGYRPNNEACLMRNMSSDAFCVVDQENIYLQFLRVVDLIDGVDVSYSGSDVTVTLDPVPLAQFRAEPLPDETYELTWTQDGVARNDLADVYSFTESRSSAAGSWVATLQFSTPEVREDPNNLLRSTSSFVVTAGF